MKPAAALLVLLALATHALAEEAPDWGFTEIDQITLGEQLVGEPLSHHDLRGRVVLLYQWGITCPISTGAFPYMNRLVERFGSRGLVVVGFQVRRNPDVLGENVQYFLNRLQPDFPVCRLGNDWDWPARSLPWGLLYDHTGKKIYGGNLRRIDQRIEAALEKAGSPALGGPYPELADLVAMAAKPSLAPLLAEARKLAATDGSPKQAEAQALLARVELWRSWWMEKADLAPGGPVQAAEIYGRLCARLKGDPLAAEPAKRLEAILQSKGWNDEEEARRNLTMARRVFCHLPPAGSYAYNMDYTESTDADLLATRVRMIVEFRAALEAIVGSRPKTWAAEQARDLLFLHEVPFLEKAAAERCLADAKALLPKVKWPVELYDVWLLVRQVNEGYFGEDAIAAEAAKLHAELVKRSDEIRKAGHSHRNSNSAEQSVMQEVRLGGSALLRVDADKLIAQFERITAKAGAHSRVTKRIRAFVEDLERSYAGTANLGLVFDRRWKDVGARVRYVYPRSAAERDGVRVGDVLIALDGKALESAAAVDVVLEDRKPGDTMKLKIRRPLEIGIPELEISVVLGRSLR